PVASDEIPNSEPPNVLEFPQVRPGILRYGRSQRNLGQRGKAHTGHSDLRLGRRDQYHRENECQPSHGSKCIGACPDREETCITVRIADISPTCLQSKTTWVSKLCSCYRASAASRALSSTTSRTPTTWSNWRSSEPCHARNSFIREPSC